ncbi:MAG: hypothetical protein KJ072_06570 [Verrucomicrobia bacterium]|nr:hypothetical protein [Verrucomicrobiota bacterium]
MTTSARSLLPALVSVALLVAAGCASVKVQKLNPDGTDVVGPKGMRFYMPRPYVSVFEPFVVDSKSYLVAGRLTSDRQFVWISSVPDELRGRFPSAPRGEAEPVMVPLSQVQVPSNGGGTLQAEQLTSESAAGAASNALSAPALSTERSPQPKDKAGMLNLKVSNDNQAFALTPTRRFFDILWLPDFEEYYVVQGKAGFGNAAIAMQMGQGWSLQGLEASVDNSELVKRAYSLYDKSIELLLKYGTTALGMPPIPTGGLQAETLADAVVRGEVKAGEEVTLKVTLSRLAAPGLYPILKGNELAMVKEWTTEQRDAVAKEMMVPVPPLNNVAFKTFEVLVIEAAKPVGDSPLGFATYKDLTIPQLQPTTGKPGQFSVAPRLTPEKCKEIGDDLIASLGLATAFVTQDKQGDIHVDATISATSGLTEEDTVAQIKRTLKPMLEPHGFSIASEGVKVSKEQ